MPHLLVVIIDDVDRLPDLLHAWHEIGVPGVTVLQSVGGHRTRRWLSQVGLDFLDRLFDTEEIRRRTLLAAIEEESLLDQAIGEAERVMDGFERPNSGILLVIPITLARGLRKREPQPEKKGLPPAIAPGWYVHRESKVSEVLEVLDLEPTVVDVNTPLNEVARAMLARPQSQVVNVVNKEGRLVGVLNIHQLANDIFFHIMPEEFLSEVRSLEAALDFADKSRLRTAGDAMQTPVWVKKEDMVKDAFIRMHENSLSGLPVVDDRYHVVGYINLLELLAVCLEFDQDAANERDEL
jgi:CBS domain-containing protein